MVHTVYDSMDRILKQTDTDGKTIWEYEYDLKGNVIREVDALGQDKCFRYDEAGRMTGVWEYVSPDEYRVTFYKYDDMDHVTEEKRGLHGVGKFETPTRYLTIKKTYDKEGRLVTVSDASMADSLHEPVAGAEMHHILRGIRYTYADFCPVSAEQLYGRQTTVREMNQLLIGMDSNALREFLNLEGADSEKLCQERATEQEYYQGKKALAVFHAFEKAYGNIENWDSHRYEKALKEGLCGEPDTGKESSSYNRHYVWDFRGNLLKQKDSLGGTWKYAYDLTGRLASAINPVGDKTSYVYDRFGRERSRVNGMGDCEYTLDYDALGRVTARTDGEGNTTTFAYHPGGQILNSGACIPMMHREILWRHRKTARIITIPMIQREESLANGHGERRFMKTIMMQKATAIPSPKRTRSQTLYIRVECSFTNWMKKKIRQGIMYLAMNISGWITTIT